MEELQSVLTPVRSFSESAWFDGNHKWIQLYPYDKWDHPNYGETLIDKDIAKQFKYNFDKGVRGQKIFTDFEHGLDRAKGDKASGEIKEVDVRDDGLWGKVEFTDTAKTEIDAGEWNYFSTSHYDAWTNPNTNIKHNYVLDGGGLTNKPWVKGMVPLNFSALVVERAEMAPEELHEPTLPPDPSVNPDDAADSGSRIDTPSFAEDGTTPHRPVTNKGGERMPDGDGTTFEEQLRELLEVGEDVNLIDHVKGMSDELGPLRELRKEHSEKKRFSEMFPEEFDRMKILEAANRDSEVRRFSESLSSRRIARAAGTDEEGNAKTEPTTFGLSSLAVDEVAGVVRKFSEGTVGISDFTGAIDAIMDNGIVDYGNKGSELAPVADDTAVPTNFVEARKLFSEKVGEIMEADELDLATAVAAAAKKFPELHEAYLGGHVKGGN